MNHNQEAMGLFIDMAEFRGEFPEYVIWHLDPCPEEELKKVLVFEVANAVKEYCLENPGYKLTNPGGTNTARRYPELSEWHPVAIKEGSFAVTILAGPLYIGIAYRPEGMVIGVFYSERFSLSEVLPALAAVKKRFGRWMSLKSVRNYLPGYDNVWIASDAKDFIFGIMDEKGEWPLKPGYPIQQLGTKTWPVLVVDHDDEQNQMTILPYKE